MFVNPKFSFGASSPSRPLFPCQSLPFARCVRSSFRLGPVFELTPPSVRFSPGDPANLFITPDHYIFRMLHSQARSATLPALPLEHRTVTRSNTHQSNGSDHSSNSSRRAWTCPSSTSPTPRATSRAPARRATCGGRSRRISTCSGARRCEGSGGWRHEASRVLSRRCYSFAWPHALAAVQEPTRLIPIFPCHYRALPPRQSGLWIREALASNFNVTEKCAQPPPSSRHLPLLSTRCGASCAALPR